MDTLDDTVHAVLTPIELLARAAPGLGRLDRNTAGLRRAAARTDERSDARTGSDDRRARRPPLSGARRRPRRGHTADRTERPLTARADPNSSCSEGLHALAALPAQLSQLTAGLDRLRSGADRLATGTRESEEGAVALTARCSAWPRADTASQDGLSGLSGGAGKLADGLGQLERPATQQLASGLGKLAAGNERLAGGLGKLDGRQRAARERARASSPAATHSSRAGSASSPPATHSSRTGSQPATAAPERSRAA